MSDNPYVKKAVLGTKDYHETMRGIVRTIVNDGLHEAMNYRADKMKDVNFFVIKPFPSSNLGFLKRFTIQTDLCYDCVLKIRRWQRAIFYIPHYILVADIYAARPCSCCGKKNKTLTL